MVFFFFVCLFRWKRAARKERQTSKYYLCRKFFQFILLMLKHQLVYKNFMLSFCQIFFLSLYIFFSPCYFYSDWFQLCSAICSTSFVQSFPNNFCLSLARSFCRQNREKYDDDMFLTFYFLFFIFFIDQMKTAFYQYFMLC